MGALALLIASWLGLQLYESAWSPAAQARKAGDALLRAAVEGDAERVAALLAPDADRKAVEIVAQYQGLSQPRTFDLVRALPNRSGVEFIVQAGAVQPDGTPVAVSLAMKRVEGRWLAFRIGSGFSF